MKSLASVFLFLIISPVLAGCIGPENGRTPERASLEDLQVTLEIDASAADSVANLTYQVTFTNPTTGEMVVEYYGPEDFCQDQPRLVLQDPEFRIWESASCGLEDRWLSEFVIGPQSERVWGPKAVGAAQLVSEGEERNTYEFRDGRYGLQLVWEPADFGTPVVHFLLRD